MEKYIIPALTANAASLGVHWIYDHVWLKNKAQTESLWFRTQSSHDYQEANPAYHAYPHMKLGDVTVQGQMMMWLYPAMKDNPRFNVRDYSNLLYQHFKPGGTYQGYVESYAKKHVVEMLSSELNLSVNTVEKNDDHLVGFVPYFVTKELALSIDLAFELTKLYTNDTSYYAFFKMFDYLFERSHDNLKITIEQAIHIAPLKFQHVLKQATQIQDTETFVVNYAGRACSIQYSIPVIIHLLYHHQTFESAMNANMLIGGAIADRAMFLGALYHQIKPLDAFYLEKLPFRTF